LVNHASLEEISKISKLLHDAVLDSSDVAESFTKVTFAVQLHEDKLKAIHSREHAVRRQRLSASLRTERKCMHAFCTLPLHAWQASLHRFVMRFVAANMAHAFV